MSFFLSNGCTCSAVASLPLVCTIFIFAVLLSSSYWWEGITPREGHGTFIWQYGLMMTNPIILEFLMGIIAAILYLRMNSKITWLGRVLMLCAVGYFCFTCYTLYSPWQSRESGHLGGYSLACFMLLLAGLKYEKVRARRYPSWLMFTGEISYSMYLLHMAVMFSSIYVLKKSILITILIPLIIDLIY